MQVLKKKVRARIVEAAAKEFKETSYEKSSMRTIAKNASMTVGNLYRYYKNKEELFGAVISELVTKLKKMIANVPEVPKSQLSYLLSNFKDLQQTYPVEWLTLFDKSSGTKYKKIADDIHQILKNSVIDILQGGGQQPELAEPIASSILFGLNSILRSPKTNKDFLRLANKFLDYMIVDFSHNVA